MRASCRARRRPVTSERPALRPVASFGGDRWTWPKSCSAGKASASMLRGPRMQIFDMGRIMRVLSVPCGSHQPTQRGFRQAGQLRVGYVVETRNAGARVREQRLRSLARGLLDPPPGAIGLFLEPLPELGRGASGLLTGGLHPPLSFPACDRHQFGQLLLAREELGEPADPLVL